jgi:uncharacterized protein DUF6932
VIPSFSANGNLPPGIHRATLEELAGRFGGNDHRGRLLEGLRAALVLLKAADCRTVYVNGSFVTAKEMPGDFDACWDVTDVDEELVAPIFFDFSRRRAAQKARFHGEFFPAQLPEGMSGLTFLDFFQTERETGRPKGIVALDLGDLP